MTSDQLGSGYSPFSSMSLKQRPGVLPSSDPTTTRQANIICLADVEPQPIEWLWQDRLASGTLAMLSGAPGAGKTWVALAIAAALSRGQVPCSDECNEPSTVLYATTESPEIVRHRFAQLDGDSARLLLLRGVVAGPSGQPAALNLHDTPVLEDALQRTRARLLIVDPLHPGFCQGAGPQHPDATRPVLENLALLAERHRCCILFVRHLIKRGSAGTIRRGPRAIELSAAVRTEFLAGSSPDAPSRCALLQIKSNLGPLAPALGYRVDATGVFTWTGHSELTREDMLSDRPSGAGSPKRRLMAEWLREHLQNGSCRQWFLEREAVQDGFSVSTLRRGKLDLGVKATKDGKDGSWHWSLPPVEESE